MTSISLGGTTPVRVIKSLARGEIGFDFWPNGYLTSVGKQHANDSAFLYGFLNWKQGLAWHPSVFQTFIISLAFTLTYYHVETIVAQVTSLTRTLNTIADDGDGLILQHFASLLQGKLLAGDHCLDNATKIHFCHFTLVFMRRQGAVNISLMNPHALFKGFLLSSESIHSLREEAARGDY